MKVNSLDTPQYWPASYSLISRSKKIWPIPTALPPWYLQLRSAKMIHKIHRQAVLSVSVWFLHLPADRLLYCLGHWPDLISTVCALWDAGTANSREASPSSGSGQNLYGLLHATSSKKGWQGVSCRFSHPLFRCVFHCKRIQHLLFKLKTVSVHIWHRSNFASVDCSETREIPDVKNVGLREGTARSTLKHQ